jgi:protein NrfD
VTAVFFLFLLHLSLGLLATLPLVPDRAGRAFFKLCSASAAFMTTAGLGLAYRRWGLAGGLGAPGGDDYRLALALTAGFLAATVLYNRARHFGWTAIWRTCAWAGIALGLAAAVAASPGPLFTLADLTSALLLGAAVSAMVLGHYYLVVLDLPIAALRRLTVLLIAALVLRGVVVGFVLASPVHAGYEEARAIAVGLWSPDGIFVWMRLLFGIAGPLSLVYFIWKTVEIRSTQSATGILYVQLFLVLAGELLAKYLRVAAGFPL